VADVGTSITRDSSPSEGGWLDVSMPLRSTIVRWPTDPAVKISRLSDIARGDQVTVSHLSMTVHTGTHVDAPLHFVGAAEGIDAMSLSTTIGPARIIQINDPRAIHAEELIDHDVRHGERLLFRTRNSERDWSMDSEFDEDYVYIAPDSARYLAAIGIRLVGIDYLSIGGFHEGGAETHQILLSAGIYAIEGLLLTHVEAGDYELVCLPLKIIDADGAPARAIIRPLAH
jgi:arylformamidase